MLDFQSKAGTDLEAFRPTDLGAFRSIVYGQLVWECGRVDWSSGLFRLTDACCACHYYFDRLVRRAVWVHYKHEGQQLSFPKPSSLLGCTLMCANHTTMATVPDVWHAHEHWLGHWAWNGQRVCIKLWQLFFCWHTPDNVRVVFKCRMC